MTSFVAAVFSLLLRVVWVVFGLVLLASFVFAAIVALLLWGARYGWARLTGKPAKPFIFSSFSQGQRTQWGQFKSTTDSWTAKAKGQFSPEAHTHVGSDAVDDVTDVESRPSNSSGSSR